MLRPAVLIALTALTLIGSPLVAAAQAPSLNWGSHVNPARCPTEQGYRYLEINVTRKVENDFALTDALDIMSRPWAAREFNQHIQVWKVGVTGGTGERFCALVRYQGSFTTPSPSDSTGPNSPAESQNILGGSDRSFEGGYLLVFDAEERPIPTYKTQGHIGTFRETPAAPLPLDDWHAFYFMNVAAVGFPQWWGWIYHGGHNGAWVNSIEGNQGDIVD